MFTEILEEYLPRKLWKTLVEIDLSGNPFDCSCRLVWFIRWLRSTNVTVLRYNERRQNRCYSPADKYNKPLENLTKAFEMNCFAPPPDYWMDFVIGILVAAMLASMLGSLIHRFRWHVRYWRFVYEVCNRI